LSMILDKHDLKYDFVKCCGLNEVYDQNYFHKQAVMLIDAG